MLSQTPLYNTDFQFTKTDKQNSLTIINNPHTTFVVSILLQRYKKVILLRFKTKKILYFCIRKLNLLIGNNMKYLSYILLISAIMLFGCSGATGSNPEKSANAEAQLTSGGDEGSQESGKPVYLDKEKFKRLVMDYEKNPKQWIYEGDKPAVIDFYADWCKPCRMIAPIMEELATEYEGEVVIYKVDTQVERELASVFGIQSLPTVVFVPLEGNPSAQKGALPKESYKQIIDSFLLKKK